MNKAKCVAYDSEQDIRVCFTEIGDEQNKRTVMRAVTV